MAFTRDAPESIRDAPRLVDGFSKIGENDRAVHNKDYGPGIQGEDKKVCTVEKEDSILNTWNTQEHCIVVFTV